MAANRSKPDGVGEEYIDKILNLFLIFSTADKSVKVSMSQEAVLGILLQVAKQVPVAFISCPFAACVSLLHVYVFIRTETDGMPGRWGCRGR